MRIFTVFVLALLTAFLPARAQEPLQIGFVYVSPVSDAGWTYQHDLGRRALEAEFGGRISTTFVESVSEGADAERVINNLAQRGHRLIFTASFGYMEPTLKAARRHADVVFEHATGYKTAANMGNYTPRFYEGRYLGGIVAGAKTQSGVIGYIAAFPIPEVIRGINAFTRGAQSVNPDISVKVIWVNSWYDPGKESEAAEALLAQGADVLTHHTDSPVAVQTAESRGKYAIAYHSDMSKYGPRAQAAAVVHKWEDFYIRRAREVLDGAWTSRSVWDGIAAGMVDIIVNEDAVSADIAAMVRDARAAIIAGDFHPFQGPVVKQDGDVVVAAGATMSDADLLNMDYYVRGVEGGVPQ